jgi:Protein of unknown function (DUF3106)
VILRALLGNRAAGVSSATGPVARSLLIVLPVAVLLALWLLTSTAWSQSSVKVPSTGVAQPAVEKSLPAKETRPFWQQLTPKQQEALEPLKSAWTSLDATGKQAWLKLSERMSDLSDEERARVQQRMSEWVSMSPKERGQARIHFQEARRLAPGGRQEHWDAYQALPQEQRRALAAQALATTRKAAPAVKTAKGSGSSTWGHQSVKPVAQGRPQGGSPTASTTPKLVAPTIVQSRQGATTSLVTTQARPPAFHHAGLPKVNAGEGFVDPATLLPRRGPQGVAATPPSLSADPSVPATVDD